MNDWRDPWEALGLDSETSDERAIKRAYAQKLKAIDVETDQAGFIALRGAMESARNQLRWRAWQAEQDAAEHDEIEGEDERVDDPPVDNLDGSATAPAEPAHAVDPRWADAEKDERPVGDSDAPILNYGQRNEGDPRWADAEKDECPVGDNDAPILNYGDNTDDPNWQADGSLNVSEADIAALNGAMDALSQKLYSDEPVADIHAIVVPLWDAVIANPAMERIDVVAGVEDWLTKFIVDTMPRSDPLIPLAIAKFDWSGSAQNWSKDPRIAAILQRADALQTLEDVQKEYSHYYYAHHLLQAEPARFTKEDRINGAQSTADLLNLIYNEQPTLQWNYDPLVLDAWASYFNDPARTLQEKLTGKGNPTTSREDFQGTGGGDGGERSWFSYWWVFWGIFALLRLVSSLASEPSKPLPVAIPDLSREETQNILDQSIMMDLKRRERLRQTQSDRGAENVSDPDQPDVSPAMRHAPPMPPSRPAPPAPPSGQ